ncbi:hypothetical protein BP5796_07077 [Coleophoma crateriformis]|uniref:O-methyltransferase C-terminal domain-containing protein n=1 Tax=Coleophoma crateriformis TaxID=565419 RepID=A0A3D8RHW0_9HELO|nr:hypothetical protein BP5796_07077 [Coleophoma crateriformis]
MAPARSLLELASTIQAHTVAIDGALKSEALPEPTFQSGGPPVFGLPASQERDRVALLEALEEMRALLMGPVPYVVVSAASWIPQKLELNERISYAELGKRCGLTEANTQHIVRTAISLRFFEEPEKDIVMHNSFSHALATVPGVMDWVGFCAEDVLPAAAKWAECLKAYPGSEDTTKAAFAMANGGQDGYFSLLDKDAKRQQRFANGQGLIMAHPARDPVHFVNSVDWSGDKCPQTVVDIGGSNGPLMVAILNKFPGIRQGVVQDLPGVVSQAKVPDGLQDRMSFEAYDFFTTQPRKADVHIFRVILHDWPDADVIRILRNQIPVLEPGHRIILNEVVVEGSPDGRAVEDQQKWISDVMMHLLFNAKERSRDDWIALFAAADPRFHVESFTVVPPAVLSTIVVVWTGS